MIGVVDYGLGNVQAILNIYNRLGIPAVLFSEPTLADKLSHIILPGVGSFDWAMHRLNSSGLRELLDHLVLEKYLPVLGICVGMQIMANRSDEGNSVGLGWIPGVVKQFDIDPLPSYLGLPHMGWNNVKPHPHPLLNNILNPSFYFLHSYFFEPSSPDFTLAESSYGHSFVSAVFKENVMGVQFHPEKSHSCGVQLLKNFASISY